MAPFLNALRRYRCPLAWMRSSLWVSHSGRPGCDLFENVRRYSALPICIRRYKRRLFHDPRNSGCVGPKNRSPMDFWSLNRRGSPSVCRPETTIPTFRPNQCLIFLDSSIPLPRFLGQKQSCTCAFTLRQHRNVVPKETPKAYEHTTVDLDTRLLLLP